jgi:hypothetical protein
MLWERLKYLFSHGAVFKSFHSQGEAWQASEASGESRGTMCESRIPRRVMNRLQCHGGSKEMG